MFARMYQPTRSYVTRVYLSDPSDVPLYVLIKIAVFLLIYFYSVVLQKY